MVTEVLTDADLLLRYHREGDEAAFAALVQRHVGMVYRAALRKTKGNGPMAEEVAQRVFTLLAQKAARLINHNALTGWMHQTTCFMTSEALRTERRRRAREQEAFAMRETDSEERNSGWSAIAPLIDNALATLAEDDLEAVLLRYFEELPHAQIGARLSISENAARMRVDRALDKLHMKLSKQGITSTTAALSVALAAQAGTAAVPASLAGSIAVNALACAGAVTAVATAKTGLITFMTTTKGAAWVAGAVTILTLSISGYTAAQRADAAVQATAEINLVRDLAQESAALSAQLAKTKEAVLNTPAPAKSIAPASAGTAPSSGVFESELARLRSVIEARQKRLAANPEYQQRWSHANAVSVNLDHQSFYRATGLSAAQISRFEEILTKWAWDANDLTVTVKTLQLSADDPAVIAERTRQETAKSAELAGLLSPEQLTKLQTFDHTATTRSLVEQVATGAYYLPTPLTADQGARLQQLLNANDPNLMEAGPAWRLDGINWAAVLQQSEATMTPAQFKVLEAVAARAQWVGEQVRIANQWKRK